METDKVNVLGVVFRAEDGIRDYDVTGVQTCALPICEQFLGELAGVTDPETKRKTIGRLFVEVFDREAAKIEGAAFLAQGTLYPDVIESVSARGGPSAVIKSHHNVGGLPDYMKLKLVEPLQIGRASCRERV